MSVQEAEAIKEKMKSGKPKKKRKEATSSSDKVAADGEQFTRGFVYPLIQPICTQ